MQDSSELNLFAGAGVALREASIPGAGEADYLFIAGREAVGILEAKLGGNTLTGVGPQTPVYAEDLSEHMQARQVPLPMLYKSTGRAILAPCFHTLRPFGLFFSSLQCIQSNDPSTLGHPYKAASLN